MSPSPTAKLSPHCTGESYFGRSQGQLPVAYGSFGGGPSRAVKEGQARFVVCSSSLSPKIPMILTISTTYEPATDLGFLLHKNPDRHQTVELSFGTAHVAVPRGDRERCSAALLVDVDPSGSSAIAGARGERLLAVPVRERPALRRVVVHVGGAGQGLLHGDERPEQGAPRARRARDPPRGQHCRSCLVAAARRSPAHCSSRSATRSRRGRSRSTPSFPPGGTAGTSTSDSSGTSG